MLKSEAPPPAVSNDTHHIEVEEDRSLREAMETRWEEEDEEMGIEEGPEMGAYAVQVGMGAPPAAPSGVASEPSDLVDMKHFMAAMERQWQMEDDMLDGQADGPVACEWAGAAPRLNDCGVMMLGVQHDSEDEIEEDELLGLLGPTGGTSVSVSRLLSDHIRRVEGYAAERVSPDNAARKKAAPYPTAHPTAPGGPPGGPRGYYRSGPTRENPPRAIAKATTGAQAPGKRAEPVVEVSRRSDSAARQRAPGAADLKKGPAEAPGPSGEARKTGKEGALVPTQLRPKPSKLTQRVDWESVCEKVLGTKGLDLGSFSLQELLVVSPLLSRYLYSVTKTRKDLGMEPEVLERMATVAEAALTESPEREHPAKEAPGAPVPELSMVQTSVVAVEPSLGGGARLAPPTIVSVPEARGWIEDREVCPVNQWDVGVHYSSGPEPSKGEVAGWDDRERKWSTSPLSVKTVLVPVALNGVKCLAIVDDASQINLVSDSFYDRMTQQVPSPIRTDLQYWVTGVHGEAVPLAGYFEAEVKIGALVTHHLFWVNRHAPKDKIFLGMPYIAQNLVDFCWSGYRRIMRVNAPMGVLEVPLHPDSGPVVTVAEERPWKDQRKPIGTRLRSLRLMKEPPAPGQLVDTQFTYMSTGEELSRTGCVTGVEPSVQGVAAGDVDCSEDVGPVLAHSVFGAQVESPESIQLEYTWTPRARERTPPSRSSREATPTPKRVRFTAPSGMEEDSAFLTPEEATGGDCVEDREEEMSERGSESSEEELWEKSQAAGERVEASDLLPEAISRVLDFVENEEEAEDCLELVVEDRASQTVLLLGPTGRYYHSREPKVAQEVRTTPRQMERRYVTAYGAYKPVAKKKRPVETTMKEEDKPLMRVPPGLMDDLPPVQLEGPDLSDLPEGKRLTPERMEKVVFSMTDF